MIGSYQLTSIIIGTIFVFYQCHIAHSLLSPRSFQNKRIVLFRDNLNRNNALQPYEAVFKVCMTSNDNENKDENKDRNENLNIEINKGNDNKIIENNQIIKDNAARSDDKIVQKNTKNSDPLHEEHSQDIGDRKEHSSKLGLSDFHMTVREDKKNEIKHLEFYLKRNKGGDEIFLFSCFFLLLFFYFFVCMSILVKLIRLFFL